MKQILIDVSNCSLCPHNFQNEIDKTLWFCTKKKTQGLSHSMPDYPTIPEWCPLPDKEIDKGLEVLKEALEDAKKMTVEEYKELYDSLPENSNSDFVILTPSMLKAIGGLKNKDND